MGDEYPFKYTLRGILYDKTSVVTLTEMPLTYLDSTEDWLYRIRSAGKLFMILTINQR